MDGYVFFRQMLELRGLNPNALADSIGLPTMQSKFDRFSKGKIKQPQRDDSIEAAARYLGINAAAFYDGAIADAEWARVTGKHDASASTNANVEPGPDIRGRVPLISFVQAGLWHDAEDPFHPGDAEDWLLCPRSHSPRSFALRVRGDSMTAPHGNARTYPAGCIIFVDPEMRCPSNGDRIIARRNSDGTVTFKVYKNEDGRQWLQPLNPAHEPIREPFTVLGTVIGKWEDE